jgi:hypothetical protein
VRRHRQWGSMLVVSDFKGRHEIADRVQLESLLQKRYSGGHGELVGNYNEFNLTHDDVEYPVLCIVVKDRVGAIIYFPGDHPGFRALGRERHIYDPNDYTEFYIGEFCETITAPSIFMLEWDAITRVAEEFRSSNELPRCIEWFEL